MPPHPHSPELEAEIACLGDLGLEKLRARYIDLCGQPAPKVFRCKLLVRAIAYQMQAKAYGGLSSQTKRRLRTIADNAGSGNGSATPPVARIKPGTRLVRDWNGATHIVDVVEDGYVWNGERYRSLSVIARKITGTRWSGPRFFGVGSGGTP